MRYLSEYALRKECGLTIRTMPTWPRRSETPSKFSLVSTSNGTLSGNLTGPQKILNDMRTLN
jgi:hypothetical protein